MNANLLLVDDEVNIRCTLSKILGKQGYGVSTAADAAETIDAVRQQRFHVLVADLKMPDMDGFAYCARSAPSCPMFNPS